MYRSCISGIGHHLPERIVTNEELGAMLDVNNDFIVKLTGIHERRWVEKGETVSNLSLQASRKAISQAGITPEDIGMIIFSSMGSDYQFPGGGCDLQHKLGIAGPPALDIRNACNGFVYGLSVADQYIKTGMYEHILLVGAEIQSTSLDLTPKGKNMSILFGDGAGAASSADLKARNAASSIPRFTRMDSMLTGSFRKLPAPTTIRGFPKSFLTPSASIRSWTAAPCSSTPSPASRK